MLPRKRAEESGLLGSAAQAKRGRERAGRLGSARAGLQATGPQVRFLFFSSFLFSIFQSIFPLKFLNQFCNPVKTTHYNKAYAPA
jgi:hypothetical protein